MSACDELRPKAPGIAALPAGDPEREEWLRHARGCPGCMEALRKAESLLAALGRSELPRPSAAALRRASGPVLLRLRLSRWPLRGLAALVAFAIPVLFARHRDAEGWGAAALVLALATVLAATAGAVRAGAWVALAASAGFAVAAGGIPGFAASERGLAGSLGIDCLGIELAGAAIAAGIVLWRVPRSAMSLAAAAGAGALAAQAALHLTCSAHGQAPHLWVFHVGGVAMAALAGFIVEQRLYAMSSARS